MWNQSNNDGAKIVWFYCGEKCISGDNNNDYIIYKKNKKAFEIHSKQDNHLVGKTDIVTVAGIP